MDMMYLVIGIVIIILLSVSSSLSYFFFKPGGGIIPIPKKLGETCQLHTDCEGWGPGQTDVACCGLDGNKTCTRKQIDFAGVGYCPEECKATIGSPPGTCDAESGGARKLGQSCQLHTDCQDFGPGQTDVACCGSAGNKTCKRKLPNYAGVGYCPEECQVTISSPPGTCSNQYSWPRLINEPCSLPTDCANHNLSVGSPGTSCCQGTCQSKKRDWAGNYYCPFACVGSPAGQPGTC